MIRNTAGSGNSPPREPGEAHRVVSLWIEEAANKGIDLGPLAWSQRWPEGLMSSEKPALQRTCIKFHHSITFEKTNTGRRRPVSASLKSQTSLPCQTCTCYNLLVWCIWIKEFRNKQVCRFVYHPERRISGNTVLSYYIDILILTLFAKRGNSETKLCSSASFSNACRPQQKHHVDRSTSQCTLADVLMQEMTQ